jgi:sigma-54 dependent transcriptional regulator, acetoin dehydrogenase operon transcriptional activator AcoR
MAPAEHPPGLAGRSARLSTAFRNCRDVLGSRVLVISGEAGVGKSALVRSLHDAAGTGPLVMLDATALESDGAVAWLGELRGELAGEPGTLLVGHIDLLPRSVRATVGSLLGTATKRGWRCAATQTCGVPLGEASLPGADAVEIELGPLRERIDDIPDLVEHFAAGRRVAPAVMQLLTRVFWPGNVRELQWTVQRLVSARRVARFSWSTSRQMSSEPPAAGG